MKTLNLVNSDDSHIRYKISKFPDGQQQVKIEGLFCVGFDDLSPIEIRSRLNNWLDLELIVCSVASLRELGIKEIHLYTPYIIGARSDRKFEEGSNNYLKDVICPIINSLKFESVTCRDSHSYVSEGCLNRFKSLDNQILVTWALDDLDYYDKNSKLKEGFILVSPDAGASHKIYKLSENISYKGEIITCSKERDKEGKLTQVNLGFVPNIITTKDLIIIDDICDGGATFINIAKKLKELGYKGKIYLIVTHGIFSKGLKELSKYFNGIYSTNSYRDIGLLDDDYLFSIDRPFVKQLNIF